MSAVGGVRAGAFWLCLTLVLSCTQEPRYSAPAAEIGADDLLYTGCSNQTGTSVRAEAKALLVVTAETCLSCRGVAHAIRMVHQDSVWGKHTELGIPIADTGFVCSFQRVERLRMPTRGIRVDANLGEGGRGAIRLFLGDPRGTWQYFGSTIDPEGLSRLLDSAFAKEASKPTMERIGP